VIWRIVARVEHVVLGTIVWSAPGHLVGWLAEPAWAYVFFPLLLYGVWRGAAVRVREEAGALVVRNVVLAFRVPWENVEDVSWGESFAAPHGIVVPLVRVRGRERPVPVLAMACWETPRRADADRARAWTGKPPVRSRRRA
jgi:hypothetical protein